MRADRVPAAREVVMRRGRDVHVVIEPRAVGIELAAEIFGQVSPETIRRMQDEEGFPCVRIGTRRLVPVAEADAWFAARALRDTLPQTPAAASRRADELATLDESPFALAFQAEMARSS